MKDFFQWLFWVICLVLAIIVLIIAVASLIDKSINIPSPYDINRDGKIDSQDSKIVYDVFLDCYVATPELITRCDLDHDGFVTDRDVSALMQFILTHDSQGNPYPEAAK